MTPTRNAKPALGTSKYRLTQLAAHMEALRDEERLRIARKLHDDIGQALAAVRMELFMASRLPQLPESVSAHLRSSMGILDEAIPSVRNLVSELRPGVLDLGLQAAVEWAVEEFQARSGIRCTVHCSLEKQDVAAPVVTDLFRILEAAFANIREHSGASAVAVRLTGNSTGLSLEIRDDGRGTTRAESRRTDAFGFLRMRARAARIKGRFSVRGVPGRGTRLRIRIPAGSLSATRALN